MKIPANGDAEASWIFDEIGQITQSPEIVKASFRKLELSDALVREVIQNSLDARRPGETLKMLFSLNKIERSFSDKYLESLIDHLEAENYPGGGPVLSEEKISEVKTSDMVNLLCIEDLGTTGLDGDVMSLESNFGAFFRGEGISSKQGTKGGRWGQGKTTFNMASKIKSFWGLTRRHSDSREYLMGKTLLNPHVLNGKKYVYHGLYTKKESEPVSDAAVLREFKQRMKCMRGATESGLSIVIPYPFDEITKESIIKAALIHYFFPIINKDLTIKIRDYDASIQDIDDTTIRSLAESLDWSNTLWERQQSEDNLEVLRFSEECVEILSNDTLIELPESVGSSLLISEEAMQNISNIGTLMNEFNIGHPLGFKIPVNIIKSDGTERSSHFFIFIKKYLNRGMTRADEYYIRSGITLSEEGGRLRGRPVRGILYADDLVISEFLGDAEEPMHTKWNEIREGLREKYTNHRRSLRFIRNAMKDIVLLLDMQSREIDYDLLEHIFSIPDPERPEKDDQEKEKKESEKGPKDPIPPGEKDFTVEKYANGFVIKYDGKVYEYPVSARVRIAYDVQRGTNPFSSYESFDFDLNADSIKIEKERAQISRIESNYIFFVLEHWKASVKITGFDEDRDLIVRVDKVNQ